MVGLEKRRERSLESKQQEMKPLKVGVVVRGGGGNSRSGGALFLCVEKTKTGASEHNTGAHFCAALHKVSSFLD